MSRTFKVTKSTAIDLTPEAEDKTLLVMAYSYFTSRKRVPGGMSKEAKEALKNKPRDSEYRIDGVIAKASELQAYVESISGEADAGKPWTWMAGDKNDREYIYSNSMSTQGQAVKWWKSRIAKAADLLFDAFMASDDAMTEDKTPNGKMRFPTAAVYTQLGTTEAKTLAEIVEVGLASETPYFFEYKSERPMSGAAKKA